jgi:protocatechuate 3,4-dioxygenase beta subunit
VKDAKQRESIIREFAPLPDSKIGELVVKFDIVMGFTPGDN